jgi:uncharacterized protein YycO
MQIFVFLIITFFVISFPNNASEFELQQGDILFQDGSNNDFNDAVKEVTNSIGGYNFSHCGIYYIDNNGKSFVIEAFNNSVILTEIDNFMNRYLTKNNQPKVVVGRLVDSLKTLIPSAIHNALKYLNKKYDNEFNLNNDEIYCSELIYFAYKDSSGKNIFETNPMTFIDTKTNKIQTYWLKHFNSLGIPVPEGKEGINPGGISRNKTLKIVHCYF